MHVSRRVRCLTVREYVNVKCLCCIMFVSLIKSGSVSTSACLYVCVSDESPQTQQPAAVEQR